MNSDVARRPAPRQGRTGRLTLSAMLCLGLGLTLAGCKSSSEKAEEYYQSGLQLLAEGDPERAILQFRNVFDVDGTHYEARKTLADLHRSQGRDRDAYSQYLRLAEQYPDDLMVRITLARMAFATAQQQEFERHAARAVELAPGDGDVQAIDLARRYAVLDDEASANDRREIVDAAAVLAVERPDDTLLLGVLLDHAARTGDLDASGQLIDRLIALEPDNRLRYQQRLAWLSERQDMAGIEAHLRATIDRFPDDAKAQSDLVRFYVSQDKSAEAEAYLRELADAAPAGEFATRVELIRYVETVRGEDAARAEIGIALDRGGDPLIYEVLGAGFDYRAGRTEDAIARMRGALEGVTEPTERSHDARIQLARMLQGGGDQAAARAEVAQVLAQNPGHIGALKIQAGWSIAEDRIDDAVLDLRGVLDQAPEDAQAMSLMADAYYRAGEPDLARDFLAQAAEASGNAPAETLRFAQLLLDQGRFRPAEDAILPALRRAPENVALLTLLGQVYIRMPDLPRAEGVIRRLAELEDPQAREAASRLELARISAADGQSAALTFLEDLASRGDAQMDARLTLLRARLSGGDVAGAQSLLADLLAEQPENPLVRQAQAVTLMAAGDPGAARTIIEDLIARTPEDPAPHLMRVRLVRQSEDPEAALAVTEASLQVLPDNPDLLWIKAGLVEQAGDIDAAIAIFDRLYQQNSGSVVTANNLASLLATHYADDPARLAQATTVARRLRDTTVPAFMDTYGWLQHLNGKSADAVPYLTGAAAGLPGDATVQLHLGIVLATTDQTEAAQAQLTDALEMAGDLDSPAVAQARAALDGLSAPADAPTGAPTAPAEPALPAPVETGSASGAAAGATVAPAGTN